MPFQVLANQFYIYIILILVGYFAARKKIINRQNSSFLASFILHITFPLLIFTTIINLNITAQIFKNLLFVFFGSYLALFLLYLFGRIFASQLHLGNDKHRIFILHSLFGNVVFIGFPFIGSLFPGGEGILYATVFQIASDSILWTYGILFISKADQIDRKDAVKHLLNVNTIAFFSALIFLAFQLKIPKDIEYPFSALGHTTLILALVYVGYVLSGIDFKNVFKEKIVFVLSFLKLIFVPLIVLVILILLKNIFPFVNDIAISVIVLQTGMPAMATIAILARRYKSDEQLAGQNIFLTTLLSLISLPFLLFIINFMLKSA